ncbi:ribonuclease H family protein [Rhizobium leguminosarum]
MREETETKTEKETTDRESETVIFPKRKKARRRKNRNVTQSRQAALAFEGETASRPHPYRGPRRSAISIETTNFESGMHIFTDGACEPNPGPGGWGFVVFEDGARVHCDSGFAIASTNNRMEMQAVIEAMRWARDAGASKAHIHTDSQYCSRGINEWRQAWKRRGWLKAGAPIPNADLWQDIEAKLTGFPIVVNWVRGHSGIFGNEIADRLAVAALKRGRDLERRRA